MKYYEVFQQGENTNTVWYFAGQTVKETVGCIFSLNTNNGYKKAGGWGLGGERSAYFDIPNEQGTTDSVRCKYAKCTPTDIFDYLSQSQLNRFQENISGIMLSNLESNRVNTIVFSGKELKRAYNKGFTHHYVKEKFFDVCEMAYHTKDFDDIFEWTLERIKES